MNSKNKKIMIVLIVALLVAVTGGVALCMYLVPKKTTIYVFKQNVSAGTIVTSDMLMPIQADSDIYVAGAKTNASERYVTGKNVDTVLKAGDSLRMDVTEGMPLTLSLLTTTGGSTVEMAMNPEKVAVTIAVSDITGITSELKAGSKVNVYATGLFNEEYKTVLVFEGMRILAVNKNDRTLTSVTLETSTEESLKLIYYATSYSIYLGLIDSSGYEFTGTNDASYSEGASTNYTATDYEDEAESTDTTENQDQPADEATTQAPSTESPEAVQSQEPQPEALSTEEGGQ